MEVIGGPDGKRIHVGIAERRSIDTTKDIPFVERFGRALQEKVAIPTKRPPARIPNSRSAVPLDQGRSETEDLEDIEEHPNQEIGNTASPPLHVLCGKIEERDEPTSEIEAVREPLEDPEGDMSLENSESHFSTPSDALDERLLKRNETWQPMERNQENAPGQLEEGVADLELGGTIRAAQQTTALREDTELVVESAPHTIHVLGTGPIGKYIAHSLAGVPHAPQVTLLMHRPLLMQQWHEEGGAIRLLRNGKIDTKSGFNIESSANLRRESSSQRFPGFGKNLEHSAEAPETVIDSLIVTTEGHTTVSALSAIKHRLVASSTICFIQDGLGVVDLVNSVVFPDPASRPSYMLGNISHGLLSTERKFTLVERNGGTVSITMVPRNLGMRDQKRDTLKEGPLVRKMDGGWTSNSRWLMRTLSRTPHLSARGLSREDFYCEQLQRLAINSVIGPLSVMYDCSNDQLLYNYQVSRTMKLLLKEISFILQRLPEVSRAAKMDKRFSVERLERIIVSVIGKTGKNTTSMLQAVRKGEKTDIDFYSGYLTTRAAELRIECPRLDMIVSMVKGKQAMKSREKNSYIPFKDEH